MPDATETQDIGKVEEISLQEEMTSSYMQFAMSAIMARALPDVRDGLKPSQRRILVAMNGEGLTPERPHSKCAAIVGETMKTYHPHGDMAIYDTLVRMGQDFAARYPLIDPQGNFGSLDGDPAGAARYTEARLSPVAMAMLADLDRDTVDYQPTYDEKTTEPVVLPGAVPNLLCNGASGIAVGYATNIPPHNLSEIVDACVALLDDPDLDLKGLMKHVHGPDFPTAGLILGLGGIRDYFETGRGSITMQARAIIEPLDRSREAIIVTELPYQVRKDALLLQIAKLHDNGSIEGIADLRDESDRKGIRIVIELRRDTNPQVVLNQLYKRTAMRSNFGANCLALVPVKGGALVPQLCGLKDMLSNFLTHRREVITRRTQFLLDRAKARAHIVEGLLKALDIIDDVIALIRGSNTRDAARQGLMKKLGFSEVQADEILNMQLGRLTRLSAEELRKEFEQLEEAIAEYEAILASEEKKSGVIKQELRAVKKKLGDERRTRIIPNEAEDISTEDLIAQEDMCITITRDGYVKRMPVDTYRVQHRGGRGVLALSKKEEDIVRDVFVSTTHQLILAFTNRGLVYRAKAYQVPLASRQARGTPIINILPIEANEKITATIPVDDYKQGGFLVMVTKQGMIKKTALSQYDTPLRTKGLIAIKLHKGDELTWVMWTDGTKDIVLVTRQGKALRFDEAQARPMGRSAAGNKAIKLRKGDELVATAVVDKKDPSDLLVVGEKGLGKRTALDEYKRQGRNTQGIMTLKVTERTGPVVGVEVVDDDDEIMCINSAGVLIRVPVANIRRTGRSAQGVKIAALDEGTVVSAVAKVVRYYDSGDEV